MKTMNKLIVLCLAIIKITSDPQIPITTVPETAESLKIMLTDKLIIGEITFFENAPTSIGDNLIYSEYKWDEAEDPCKFGYYPGKPNSLEKFKEEYAKCEEEVREKFPLQNLII